MDAKSFERNLATIPQFVERNPAFCPTAIRSLIARAKQTGFEDVVVKIGRRVYLDTDQFWRWVEEVRDK